MTSPRSATPSATGSLRAFGVTLLLAFAALGLQLTVVEDVDIVRRIEWLPWWSIALISFGVEHYAIHIEWKGHGRSHALSDFPIMLGLIALSPMELILARMTGVLAHRVITVRDPLIKMAFNVAIVWFETTVLLAIIAVFTTRLDIAAWQSWPLLIVAIVCVDALGTTLVAAVVSISSMEPGSFARLRVQALDVIAVTFSAIAAIVLTLTLIEYPYSVWLVFVLAGLLIAAYHHHRSTANRYESLRQLSRQMDEVAAVAYSSGWNELLQKMAATFNARRAELIVFSANGTGEATRYRLQQRGEGEEETFIPDADERRLHMDMQRHPAARFLGTAVLPASVTRSGAGAKGMAAPLVVHERAMGLLVVMDKAAGERTFNPANLEQFGLFAARVGRAVEQGRLVERIREETETLRERMYVDTLTGFPSESAFHERMRATHAQEQDAAIAVVSIRNMISINRNFGRAVGDGVLMDIAGKLKLLLRDGVSVYRPAAAKFIVVMQDVSREQAADTLREWLAENDLVYHHGDVNIFAEVYCGVAHYPDDSDEPAIVMESAGVAMTHAEASREPVAVYATPVTRDDAFDIILRGDLAEAVRNREIDLAFQPKILLRNGEIIGCEALARWRHPKYGYIRPDIFIAIAEKTNIILDLSRLVFEKSLQALGGWLKTRSDLGLSMNLSAYDLRQPDLVARAAEMLEAWSIPASRITFEITETVLMEDVQQSANVIEGLHRLGIRISVDDFGTGYSSFAYLAQLHLDELKIDRSFVSNMDSRTADAAVVETLIQLAHRLNIAVVAEGVETGAVLARLAALGCDEAQGYFISRPLDAHGFETFLREREALPLSNVSP